MKLHLPKKLMAAVLVMGLVQGMTFAAMTEPVGGVENYSWTWDGSKWTNDTTGAESTPQGAWENSVWHGAYLNIKGNYSSFESPSFGDTSDGGGVRVQDGVSAYVVNLGNYGGSIYVGKSAGLQASLTWLKAPGDGASVWVDDGGWLDLVGLSNFDGGGGDQNWHIGAGAIVDLLDTNSINKDGKKWNVEYVLASEGSVEDDSYVNRTYGTGLAKETAYYIYSIADLTNSIDTFTVLDEEGNELTEGTDYTRFADSYGMGIEYKVDGYAQMDLIWNGGDKLSWEGTICLDAEGKQTTLLNGDNLMFDVAKDGISTTVKVVDQYSADTMTVNDDYTIEMAPEESVFSELSAKTINVAEGKTLTFTGSGYVDVLQSINGNIRITGTGVALLCNSINGNAEVYGGSLDLFGANAFNGSSLVIQNATVLAELDTSGNQSVINSGATVTVKDGGALELEGHDMLGWYTGSAPKIILGSENAEKIASMSIVDTRNASSTCAAAIEMNGNASITGNVINVYDAASLTVTGTNNTIEVEELQVRSGEWDVNIAENGELEISSKLTRGTDGATDISKTGEGKLVLISDESTWDQTLYIKGGTLEMGWSATLGNATVSMFADTTLEAGMGTIGTLVLAAGSTLDADTAITLGSALTLGEGITLKGSLLDSLLGLVGEETQVLFAGVATLTLGENEYTAAARSSLDGVDLATYFKGAGITAGTYYLGYDASGNVYAGLTDTTVPEPATATLGLLALAGLCSRRRRAAR